MPLLVIHSLTAQDPPPARGDVAVTAGMGEPEDRPGALSLTDRFLTRDGAPWFPIMGEYHFSRDDPDRWESELLKMKAGGITVVATYLIWIIHEEQRGTVRWDGARDIRRFLDTAHRHGLQVMLRLGPWVHGETRNGGFPDWVQSLDLEHRSNDPAYQALVRSWYSAVAGQVRGFVRTPESPDAPIIGFQTDNELYDQPDHLAWLRATAENLGLTAPFWTATGWGGAQLPENLMPIYAGYSDGFWAESDERWPAFGRPHFEFSAVRDDLSVGADVRGSAPVARAQDDRFPWVTCELGGGMVPAYHRRPIVDPADVAALALVKLGSGSACQGYYLYHGGTHAPGELSTTQESHATGYPNDMPQTDYDFFAPIGAHGQLREHYHLLRRQHLFLQQYAQDLLESTTVIAPPQDGSPRWSYRGDLTGGFLFVNNHQPAAQPLPAIPDAQFGVVLADEDVVVPRAPVTIASGASFVWPVRRPMGTLRSVTATVQPITEVAASGRSLVLVSATPGVPVEFVFDDVSGADVAGCRVVEDDGARTVVVVDGEPGPECVMRVGDTTIVVLDPHSADRVWRGDVGGVQTALIWEEGVLFDRGALRLLSSSAAQTLRAFPPLALPSDQIERTDDLDMRDDGDTVFATYVVGGPPTRHEVPTLTMLSPATTPAPQRTGGSSGRLSAPRAEDFAVAGAAIVTLPDGIFARAADTALLSLEWIGDVGRASVQGRPPVDQFWSGRGWDIPLRPGDREVRVEALALDPASDVYIDPRVRPLGETPILDIRCAHVTIQRTVDAAH